MCSQPTLPDLWPRGIEYLWRPCHSAGLTEEQRRILKSHRVDNVKSGHNTAERILVLPFSTQALSHVSIELITDRSHPACGQLGLFATRDLAPDSLVVPYLGYVHSNDPADTDPASDYDLSLDRDAGLSVDAGRMGNEGRCVNDYRGVPRPHQQLKDKVTGKGRDKAGPNAEFKDVWFDFVSEDPGERGIAIFVLGAGKSGKRKGGIKRGEEVLVSYGKGFWKERVAGGDEQQMKSGTKYE